MQYLKVLDVRVLRVDVKLDSVHRDVHEDAVEDLAQRRSEGVVSRPPETRRGKQSNNAQKRIGYEKGLCLPSAALFDLGHVQLEQAVEPVDEFLSAAQR